MLAIGQLAGVPWLVNPILAGICVLLASGVLAELYPARTRRLALLLLATSPWFLFMSMNFMNHQASLACALTAALFVAQARRRPEARLALMAAGGAFIGFLSLIRPLEALAIGLLLGFWSLTLRSGFFRLAPSVALGRYSGHRPAGAALQRSAHRLPVVPPHHGVLRQALRRRIQRSRLRP